MYKLQYLQTAINDMNGIVGYISNNLNNRTSALNLANEFIRESNNILTFPYGNPEYIPINKTKNKYHRAKFKKFFIYYTIDETTKTIIIVRVLHHKQNINKIITK